MSTPPAIVVIVSLLLVLCSIPLSSALRCTVNCSFYSDIHRPFELPSTCSEITEAKQCTFRASYWYHQYYTFLSFDFDQTNSSFGGYHSANVRLSDDGSIGLDYTVQHQCDQKDDCAIEFANMNVPNLLRRLQMNYTDLRDELWPLLASPSSLDENDVVCFDSNENVRQCAIPNKPGLCQARQHLRGNRKTNRSCDAQPSHTRDKLVSMFELSNMAFFEVKCNRSLCNGPLTFQTVKELMFKYQITNTPHGHLNHGVRAQAVSFVVLLCAVIRLLLLA